MKLIDLDELMKFPLRIDNYDKENGNEVFMLGIESVLDYAEELPAVDAVPVIRCKDCKYNYGNKYECNYNHEDIVCTYWMSDGLTDKDFCSKAMRKEE